MTPMMVRITESTRPLALAAMIVYFGAFTIQYATIFDHFWSEATRLSRVVQLVILAGFFCKAFARPRGQTLAWGLVGAALLISAHLLFCHLSGAPRNFNAILGYLPFLAFVPVAESDVPVRQQLRWLFIASAVYVVIYVVGNRYFVATASTVEDAAGLLNSGDSRGARIFIAGLSASFVALYAYEDHRLHAALRITLVVVAAAAIWISESRAFGAIFALIFLLHVARLTTRPVMSGLLVIFLLVSGLHLWGVVSPSWNPFQYFISDNSSYGRYLEYKYAIIAIHDHWPFGIGIDPGGPATGVYLNIPNYLGTVYFNDLGAIGPLGQFGVIGLTIFLVASIASILSGSTRSIEPGVNALRLNCVVSALYGVIAPTILYPASCFYTAVLFAMWLRLDRIRTSKERGLLTRQIHRRTA